MHYISCWEVESLAESVPSVVMPLIIFSIKCTSEYWNRLRSEFSCGFLLQIGFQALDNLIHERHCIQVMAFICLGSMNADGQILQAQSPQLSLYNSFYIATVTSRPWESINCKILLFAQ